jgi:glycosyl transferase family 25
MNNVIDNIYVINLKEASDRLEQMNRQIPILGKSFQVIEAINGKNLSKKEIQHYCTQFGQKFCTYGMIGCFLSHQKTWQTIVKNKDRYALIMEDDCQLIDTFKQDLENTLDELFDFDPEWDFLYLGYFGASDPKRNYNLIHSFSKMVLPNIKQSKIQPFTKHFFIPEAPIGFHCYIISNKGAKKLLHYLNKVSYHVDVKFLEFSHHFNVYASTKNLGYQFSTPNSSSLTQYNFPISANYFLDHVKDQHNISISYYFCAPFIQIFHIPINFYITTIIVISILFPRIIPYVLTFLLFELMVQPNNFNVILFIFMLLIIFNF